MLYSRSAFLDDDVSEPKVYGCKNPWVSRRVGEHPFAPSFLLDPPTLNQSLKRAATTHASLFGNERPVYTMEQLSAAVSGSEADLPPQCALCFNQLRREAVDSAACYVARETATYALVGYYTLSAITIRFPRGGRSVDDEPSAVRPERASRLAHLTVERGHRGRHLGSALVWDALERVASAPVLSDYLICEATNATSLTFYRHLGFEPLNVLRSPGCRACAVR